MVNMTEKTDMFMFFNRSVLCGILGAILEATERYLEASGKHLVPFGRHLEAPRRHLEAVGGWRAGHRERTHMPHGRQNDDPRGLTAISTNC